jgi:hypothetical protein
MYARVPNIPAKQRKPKLLIVKYARFCSGSTAFHEECHEELEQLQPIRVPQCIQGVCFVAPLRVLAAASPANAVEAASSAAFRWKLGGQWLELTPVLSPPFGLEFGVKWRDGWCAGYIGFRSREGQVLRADKRLYSTICSCAR